MLHAFRLSRFVWMGFIVLFCLSLRPIETAWGFFGHRRINRMAVFTLPSEMMYLYKPNIEYITEHAVDPDKRRYATKHEAVRHYIDIDHWGTYPFDDVPRTYTDAMIRFGRLYSVGPDNDTITARELMVMDDENKGWFPDVEYDDFRRFFTKHFLDQYYEDVWSVPNALFVDAFPSVALPREGTLFFENTFDDYGILPYYLIQMQSRLTDAFNRKDRKAIIRLSADFGHYIGDAHVPLHTTLNYNGQLTNQLGIHAFWESRIPELFADDQYDYLVGKAQYIEDPRKHYWSIVLDSHLLLDSVLLIEKRLSQTFPTDRQYCYEDRLDWTVRTQCEEYAAAYQAALANMVEDRMRDAILAVGSAWYTAWVDAGQPDLRSEEMVQWDEANQKEWQEVDDAYKQGDIKGREHGN